MGQSKHFRLSSDVECVNCSKVVRLRKSHIERGERLFCSMDCKNLFHAKEMDGEGNSNWIGGVSFLPYASSFTKKLKRKIIARDKNSCGICGRVVEKNYRGFSFNLVIHHIDYNKNNSSPENLMTLCCQCHGRTHYNRPVWTEMLSQKLKKSLVQTQ